MTQTVWKITPLYHYALILCYEQQSARLGMAKIKDNV